MAKISLISFYPGLIGLNLRQIGACLRAEGFEVDYLHLGHAGYQRGNRSPSLVNYPDMHQILDVLLPRLADSLYVGITLTASEFKVAREFTRVLKERCDVPVIWGGPHATAAADLCAHHADFVCVGEGEHASVAAARHLEQGKDLRHIDNLAFLEDGQLRRNPLHPLVEDLSSIPMYDTELYRQWVLLEGKLQQLSPELMLDIDRIYFRPVPDKIVYLTHLTRGCPFHCTYCNNSYLFRLYDGQRYFRHRTLDHLFREVQQAREDLKRVGAVFLADDNITALPRKMLQEFADRWVSEVGLPFGTNGSPTTITEEKMEILARTGLLFKMGLGIQSASPRILKMYDREHTADRIAGAVAAIEKFRPLFYQELIPPIINYQFIFDNPYEKTADITSTLRFIADLPTRDSITCFHLVLYPGSEIYRQAKKDGIVGGDDEYDVFQETYIDLDTSFTKVWLRLFQRGFPRALLRLLCILPVFALFNLPLFYPFYRRLIPEFAPRPTAEPSLKDGS